jgi:hypothetical protein
MIIKTLITSKEVEGREMISPHHSHPANGGPADSIIRKFIRLVCILSLVFIPINAIGFNVVYLYANFSGRYATFWAFVLARVCFFVLVGNVVVSLIAFLCDIVVVRYGDRGVDSKRVLIKGPGVRQ